MFHITPIEGRGLSSKLCCVCSFPWFRKGLLLHPLLHHSSQRHHVYRNLVSVHKHHLHFLKCSLKTKECTVLEKSLHSFPLLSTSLISFVCFLNSFPHIQKCLIRVKFLKTYAHGNKIRRVVQTTVPQHVGCGSIYR